MGRSTEEVELVTQRPVRRSITSPCPPGGSARALPLNHREVARVGGRLLRVRDVMERLGCSRATVHRRIADGTIPVVRIKGLLRFRPDVVDALVQVAEAGRPRLLRED